MNVGMTRTIVRLARLQCDATRGLLHLRRPRVLIINVGIGTHMTICDFFETPPGHDAPTRVELILFAPTEHRH